MLVYHTFCLTVGKQRSFAEIMAELENIQKKQQEEESKMADIPLPAERGGPKCPKGINLSLIADLGGSWDAHPTGYQIVGSIPAGSSNILSWI